GCICVFFFFQAEDGIRDFHVTGVQTCALPIFAGVVAEQAQLDQIVAGSRDQRRIVPPGGRVHQRGVRDPGEVLPADRLLGERRRSEERRVGKEGRGRGEADHWKRKRGRVGGGE